MFQFFIMMAAKWRRFCLINFFISVPKLWHPLNHEGVQGELQSYNFLKLFGVKWKRKTKLKQIKKYLTNSGDWHSSIRIYDYYNPL